MVYPEYVQYKSKYEELQNRFANLLLEKEKLFTDTFPRGITYDKDKVQCMPDDNPLERYAVTMDEKQIDEKLDTLRRQIKDWSILIEVKENELRKSKDIPDRIYTLRYLDGVSVSRISNIVSYSKKQIYRILGKMDKTISKNEKMTRNVTLNVLK